MPHVIAKFYPGRTENQKKELANRIKNDIMDILKVPEKSISVSLEEIPKENWKTEVWDKDIEAKKQDLYIKPGYNVDEA